MAKLAIRGHETRGNEVIALLEMLGGKNTLKLEGTDCNAYYTIYSDSEIAADSLNKCNRKRYLLFSLEEFEEKFPYKVGDKVQHKRATSCGYGFEVEKMRWVGGTIEHTIKRLWYNNCRITSSVENLQPYKEETMEEEGVYAYNEINCYHQDFGDKVRIRLGGDYEIKVEGKITYIVKKQPQYPKTYKECCEVLKIPKNEHYIDIDAPLVPSDYNRLVSTFTKLIICRDAYWRMAGEQMGLGKPWQPDWDNDEWPDMYYISFDGRYIEKETGYPCCNMILIFSTEEMRDAFYENFKDLIKECKELL